jgi:hypothetical protein
MQAAQCARRVSVVSSAGTLLYSGVLAKFASVSWHHISRSLIGQGDRFRMWPLTLFLYGSIILIVALIFGVALLVYAVTRGDDDNDEGWK